MSPGTFVDTAGWYALIDRRDALLDLVRRTAALDLEWIGADRFDRAEAGRYDDQAFSFTDCTSFAVMRELGIQAVITTDAHFRIAGFTVLPRRGDVGAA